MLRKYLIICIIVITGICINLILPTHGTADEKNYASLNFLTEEPQESDNVLARGALNEKSSNPGILFLSMYQRYVSNQFGEKCGFTPSCSQYSKEAVNKYGFLKGIMMTTDRLMRCHYCSGPYYKRTKTGRLSDPVKDNVF